MRTLAASTLILIAALSVIGTLAISTEKTIPLSSEGKILGTYTGLGWFNSDGFFGYEFRRFEVDDNPYRTWTITNAEETYNPVTAAYPDGTLALEGECTIEGTGRSTIPIFDDFSDSISYAPDGSVIAEVKDGEGLAILCFPDGTIQWEMHYKEFERIGFRLFNDDGSIKTESGKIPHAQLP